MLFLEDNRKCVLLISLLNLEETVIYWRRWFIKYSSHLPL